MKSVLLFSMLLLSTAAFAAAPERIVEGTVKDSAGNPIAGVVVSDGYTCVESDTKGEFSFPAHDEAYWVYYTTPARYRVETGDDHPDFFEKIEAGRKSYDFVLTPLDAPETRFDFFCIGDIHIAKDASLERLKNESVPDIVAMRESADVPTYGSMLGDLTTDTPQFFAPVYENISYGTLGMPVFFVIGNHDHQKNVEGDIPSQRLYESIFGPVNFSYDRGDVHFVNMDNIVYHGAKKSHSGFTDEQLRWFKQDLAHVSREKAIVLNVHVPFLDGQWTPDGASVNYNHYYHEMLDMLSEFAEAHIVAGHHHSTSNYIHTVNGKEIYEHDPGVTSGAAQWTTDINLDGSPHGYLVFEFDGPKAVNWVYKAVGHDRDYQMRMYRASDVFTGGAEDYSIRFEHHAADQIVANVWNADPEYWRVDVYEDGERTGEMTLYNGWDAWSAGFFYGIGLKSSIYNERKKEHMYYYTLKNPAAKEIVTEATDRFGNKYRCSEFTGPGTEDYPFVANRK